MNKKIILYTALLGLMLTQTTSLAMAQTETSVTTAIQNAQTKADKDVTDFIEKMVKYSNEHKLDKLKAMYASSFISGDGLNKDEVFKLITSAWAAYPNLTYKSEIKNIRSNDNFATVQSRDTADGITTAKSEIASDTGILESLSDNTIYLQKFGKDWKIVSDRVDYEKTSIRYGSAKNLNIDFYAPEQVHAGEEYTATINAKLPENVLAIAAIAKDPLVLPEPKHEELFRQIPNDYGILERVMKANLTNNNEIASASIGLSEFSNGNTMYSEIRITGIALLMQRVNVIPKSTYVPPAPNPNKNTEFDTISTKDDK